jgi:hypothetical protein
MTKSPWFPSPEPPLASVQAAIDDLASAETATHSRRPGSVAVRDEKRRSLEQLLQYLLAHIQATADAHTADAASIIESAGIWVEKARSVKAHVFTAKAGRVSGSVDLSVPRTRGAAYERGYSLDGGTTWVSLPVTVKARTTVTDLALGATVHFRYRTITGDGVGDWSDPVSIIVT